jgi:hypothetical protein
VLWPNSLVAIVHKSAVAMAIVAIPVAPPLNLDVSLISYLDIDDNLRYVSVEAAKVST